MNRSNNLFFAFLMIVLSMSVIFIADAKQTEVQKMNQTKINIFQAIDNTVKAFPLTKEKVENLFSIQLLVERNNDSFIRYVGQNGEFSSELNLEKVDLRLFKNKSSDKGFLVLDVKGGCITIESLKSKFKNLQISGYPRGRSLDEQTMHSVMQPWGKISFGFAEHTPKCLASIVFNSNARTLSD